MAVFRFRENDIEDPAVVDAFKEISNILDSLSIDAIDGDAIHDNVASEISAIGEKVTPVDADIVVLEDSAAGNVKKKAQLGNIPYPSGVSQLTDLSDVNSSTPTNKFALLADGTDFESRALLEADISDLQSYLLSLAGDASPQLGADLDCQGNNIDEGGVINLIEQAAADADVAGRGQIWIKNAVPNELWFTDDAGADAQVGSTNPAGTEVYKVKTANEVVTTSTTLQDDDHLVGFSLDAAKHYSIEALFWVSESVAGDFDYAWIFTNTPAIGRSAHHNLTAGSTDKGVTPIATRDSVTLESGSNVIHVVASFQANVTTGGTFKLQWCQGTSSGITTMFQTSWVRVTKLD